ncbi:DUF3079 domain-containing protein [Hydrogenophaga soli]
MATKRFPANPAHPERLCWGCDRYCPATDMACGNGSDRTQHPAELFGPDWATWMLLEDADKNASTSDTSLVVRKPSNAA